MSNTVATNDLERGEKHRIAHHDIASQGTTAGDREHSPAHLAPSAFRLAPGAHKPFRDLGNPAPLGLSAFALTTFVLSLINIQTRDVTTPNVVVGLALFYGGVAQFAAGMWEFACGNSFGGTALSSYGAFWLSWAALHIPSLNIVGAYNGNSQALNDALGFYLMGWFIFTFIMFLCTLRATLAFVFLFGTLDLAFLFLALGHLEMSLACQKAGGYFGLLAAFTAWYCAAAGLLTSQNSFFILPVVHFPWSAEGGKQRDD